MLVVLLSTASLDRTGRLSDGAPVSRVAAGIRSMCVQLGEGGGADVHARWQKSINIGALRTNIGIKATHNVRSTPQGTHSEEELSGVSLEEVALTGSLMDIGYEASRSIAAPVGTDVALAYSVPSGIQLMADVNVRSNGKGGTAADLRSYGAFHAAGPVNLQTTYTRATRNLRLKLGRGATRYRCPVSVQVDLPRDGGPCNYEVGMRQSLGQGRRLLARVLLPAVAEERRVWCEYHDANIDKGGVWIAKAALTLRDHRIRSRPELSLRRAWQW